MTTFKRLQTGQGYVYRTNYLLDYNYFNKYYKMIAIVLSKQQALDADLKALDADLKAIQQIQFYCKFRLK